MNSFASAVLLGSLAGGDPMSGGAPVETRHACSAAPQWVFFAPRPHHGAVDPTRTPLTARALARRAARGTGGPLVDESDLPVEPAYVAAVAGTGATIRSQSRWLHAVSVDASPAQLDRIRTLPFVRAVREVERAVRRAEPVAPSLPLQWNAAEGGVAGGLDYGAAACQIGQIDLAALHARGFRGEGMVLGVLDTGFNRIHDAFNQADHAIQVLAEWDFIDGDANTAPEPGDPPSQHVHGTTILSTMAAWLPGQLIGSAPDAAYVLAKTEITAPPDILAELDYYVAGLEFVEAQGADVATSSLGYVIGFAYPAGLDGQTCVASIAVNMATAKGMVCLTAVGNDSHDCDPASMSLWAPGDAFDVITCGAVSACGAPVGFSGDGPTIDGRVKPELLALGENTAFAVATATSGLASGSGTSLAAPLVAGGAACVLQARPCFGVGDLREALFATATGGGATDRLFIRGYGIAQVNAASLHGLAPGAGGGECEGTPSEPTDPPSGSPCQQPLCPADLDCDGSLNGADLGLLLLQWGFCDCECSADLNFDGKVDGADLGLLLLCWPV